MTNIPNLSINYFISIWFLFLFQIEINTLGNINQKMKVVITIRITELVVVMLNIIDSILAFVKKINTL